MLEIREERTSVSHSLLVERLSTFTVWLVGNRQFIQLIIIPIGFTLGGFIGIAVTSAGINLYGEVLWDPLRCVPNLPLYYHVFLDG